MAAANTIMYFIISTSKFIRTPSLGGLQGSRPQQGLETWLYITRCQAWESGWIKQFIFLKQKANQISETAEASHESVSQI